MANLTVNKATLSGLDPALAAAEVAGDEFANEQGALFIAQNDDASDVDITFASYGDTREGYATDDLVVSVPAGEQRIVGLFGNSVWSDTNDLVQVSYSSVASLEVAVVKG